MVQSVKWPDCGNEGSKSSRNKWIVILTVTPNAAVDKTFQVEGFCLDRVHRPAAAFTVAGGKGINVARVYQTLGGQAIATGLLGGGQGRIVAAALAAENLANQFVPCEGETRLCIAIVDPLTGTQTEINESGPLVSTRSVSLLLRRVQSLLSQQELDFVVMSGSLPPGAPDSLYAELIALANAAGVRAVLDSSGGALREGLAAQPWMVKPNRAELEAVASAPIGGTADALAQARRVHDRGIAVVAVTLGAEGAILVTELGALVARPPAIRFVSAVASGDAFLAAFLWEWTYGTAAADPASALKAAVGAGAANASEIGAGFCSRESIAAMAEGVTVTPG
jgi:1-phosphofructokinase family hexose kinase